jgi:hypothetical protein
MRVVNVVDAGVFRGIGNPPNEEYDTLREIVTGEQDTEIRLPRPIYGELGGDPGAESYPSGSEYVDTGVREGWISIADPIEDESPVADALLRSSYFSAGYRVE